jgi:hypothetical protein
MAEQAQPGKRTQRRIEPASSAWLILLTFFLIFCVSVAGAGVAGWRYYNEASIVRDGLLRVHVNTGVTYQDRGSAQAVSLERLRAPCLDSREICKPIVEGTRIKTRPEAGYGPVASIKLFDSTQVDLWAHPTGADLTLQTYQVSRWTRQRQVVVFRQEAGYARYDLAGDQPYEQVDYTVEISGGVRVMLARGGSYSISMPNYDPGNSLTRTDTGAPILVEVAVRRGRATVQSNHEQRTIPEEPNKEVVNREDAKKVAVDTSGRLTKPVAATWELIDDGSFDRYPKEKYDELSDAWVIRSAPAAQNMPQEQQNGTFTAVKECPPEKVDLCKASDQIYVGQFRRDGNQVNSYITAIDQLLDADVSEYTYALNFSAQVRVLTQTVALAGVAGSECPIMIALTYKDISPTDQEEQRTTCIYAGDHEALVKVPYINYIRIPFYEWRRIDIKLRTDSSPLKRVRYLQQIRIYANGHDYLSEITRVSLKGTP